MTHKFGPWIIHEGNECPVEPDALVNAINRWASVSEAEECHAIPACNISWRSVFAYRVADATKRVKVRGHIYGCSDGNLAVYDGDYPKNSASFTLSVEIDEDDKPVPGTVRLEDA